MSVLHPALLAAGLAAVAIPVLIHLLFRRRRKPIVWAAMRFLLEAYRRQRRRLTLEQLLLLLVRCALVALVALALAQPLVRSGAALAGAGAGRDVYILLDNSLTSQLRDGEGKTVFATLQEAAKAAVGQLGGGDRVAVIALGAPAQQVVLPPSSDGAGVVSAIESLQPVDAAADVPGAMELVARSLEDRDAQARPATILLLSELRRGTLDARSEASPVFEGREPPALAALAPAQDSPGQVQVASLEPARPVLVTGEGAEPVRIALRRFGQALREEGRTTLTLRALRVSRTGAVREAGTTRATVRWRRGESRRVVALQPPAIDEAAAAGAFTVLEASIDRDAISADDVRLAALKSQRRLRAVVLGRTGSSTGLGAGLAPERWAELALSPTSQSPVETLEVDPASLDAPAVAGAAAVVLVRPDLVDERGWSLLRRYVDDGGLLLVFPPARTSLHLWTDAFTKALELPWRFDREAATFGDDGRRLSAKQPSSAALSHLAPELETLAPPVTVTKALLPQQAAAQGRSQPLLTLESGEVWAALARPASRADDQQPSRGAVVFVASALSVEWTDLPARPLWVALAQEFVREGASLASVVRRQEAGRRAAVASTVVEATPVDLTGDRERRPVAVGRDGLTLFPLRKAGVFRTVDDRGRTVGLVAVNPTASAGDTQAQSPQEAQRHLEDLLGRNATIRWLEGDPVQSVAQALGGDARREGRSIGAALLLAALGTALLEMLLARLFSHAGLPSAPGAAARQEQTL
ncbi:MAG: VWA domain-containing protein [Planctomycetota bacterium]|nr:MAG: VWA domain-containing protein [Planctomycetota bacterium]